MFSEFMADLLLHMGILLPASLVFAILMLLGLVMMLEKSGVWDETNHDDDGDGPDEAPPGTARPA